MSMRPATTTWSQRQVLRIRRHAGWLAVLALLGVAVIAMALGHWRKGLVLIGIAALAAALMRALLPPRRIALLVVRTRTFDTAVLFALGAAVVVLAFVIPAIKHG